MPDRCSYYNIISSLNSTENVIVGGDINIDLFCETNAINLFMNVLYSGGFLPLITLPTRVTTTSSTLIDHLWIRTNEEVVSGVFESAITDHKLIFACVSIQRTPNALLYKCFKDHSETNLHKLKNMMNDFIRNF